MTPLAAALALTLASPPGCQLPPLAARRPWAPGEVLDFQVQAMGVVQAGTLQLAVERPILGGRQIPLRARMQNTSVFAKIRRVRGVAGSFVDLRTLRPARYRDDVDQDGLRRTTDTRLDRNEPLVRMEWTSGADKGVTEFTRESEVLDILSALYYLRAADLRPGAALCFDLLANRRYWRLAGRVAEKPEPVDTPAGSFQTVRVDTTLTRADDPTRKRPLVLWISADARRLPVAAGSEVDLGPVVATLARVSRRE
jgi:Protein of unknown function (DUF3108)